MSRARLGSITVVLSFALTVTAQPVYPTSPDWVSSDKKVSTGAALVDMDLDGWPDLVVANGNDISQERVTIYHANGDGTLPLSPTSTTWESAYNGHLDIADVNADGWPDVAVATLGTGSTTGPIARVYLNSNGSLPLFASWSADITGNAFTAAFGDVNNDGRPDLAVATGWAYGTPHQYHNYVYLNTGTGLEATASWVSDDTYDMQGALWVDADDDGWLDLVLAAAHGPSRIYRNLGGTLETTANWTLSDVASQDALMLAAGDVTGDGVRELFIADNNQLAGGSGRYRQYDGLASPGLFATTASWSHFEGYCSAVTVADVDADGLLDLIAGGWWLPTQIFFNTGSGLSSTAGWESSTSSVVHEKIVLADIDKNGLRPVQEVFAVNGSGQRLFHLPHQPVQEVAEVRVDGSPLAGALYHVNHEHGWLTVGADATATVAIDYTVSSKLDMAITDWDGNRGNNVYFNQKIVLGDANCDGQFDFGDINAFVALLVGGYDTLFPDCDGHTFCDFDGNGSADFGDINAFVDGLVN